MIIFSTQIKLRAMANNKERVLILKVSFGLSSLDKTTKDLAVSSKSCFPFNGRQEYLRERYNHLRHVWP